MGHDFNTNSLRLIRKNSKIADHKNSQYCTRLYFDDRIVQMLIFLAS